MARGCHILWQPDLPLPVWSNRALWLLSFGSIAIHEPVNSRHCRRDANHDQSEAAALLPREQIQMKVLPNKFRDQADRCGDCQSGFKFAEKQIVMFWILFALGHLMLPFQLSLSIKTPHQTAHHLPSSCYSETRGQN